MAFRAAEFKRTREISAYQIVDRVMQIMELSITSFRTGEVVVRSQSAFFIPGLCSHLDVQLPKVSCLLDLA